MTPEPLDPNKYHIFSMLNPKIKKIVYISLTLLIVFTPILAVLYYKAAVNRPSQTDNEVTIEIQSGETVSDVANLLYAQDAINSTFLFRFYFLINELQSNIQAGVYTIPAGTNIKELGRMLQKGVNDKSITFIEGWRVEEYAVLANQTFEKIDYSDFIKIAKAYEGYLFPDTYNFNIEVREQEIVDALMTNFNEKTQDILTPENLAKIGLTKEEVIIFASIVEREANKPEDRPLVAGILINRWQDNELLGADATTQYTIATKRYGCDIPNKKLTGEDPICPDEDVIPNVDWWPNDLTLTDLTTDNVYNTRYVVGLPPAPIANPGLDAIQAVVNYTNTDYRYYLHDNDGDIFFAKTLDEHNANIAKYL